jgi:hypothetical protein
MPNAWNPVACRIQWLPLEPGEMGTQTMLLLAEKSNSSRSDV